MAAQDKKPGYGCLLLACGVIFIGAAIHTVLKGVWVGLLVYGGLAALSFWAASRLLKQAGSE